MKAMILAAGRGERMRPITDKIPKPLLRVGGKSLIEHKLESLSLAGIRTCIINLSYRAEQIQQYLGNGERWDMEIRYSHEGDRPLESAGGIVNALPLLGGDPFLLVNADIWTDFDFDQLPSKPEDLAHLVMVDNPGHNPAGDFSLDRGKLYEDGKNMLTYSGIGVYDPALFRDCPDGKRPLKPLLVNAMRQQRISGERYSGIWLDIGTPERLAAAQVLNARSGQTPG